MTPILDFILLDKTLFLDYYRLMTDMVLQSVKGHPIYL